MAFTDEVTLNICAGKGGDGIVAWHRNRRMSRGGPAGGNGGRGGDVYLRGVRDSMLLSKYASQPSFKAQDGANGGKSSLEGRNGDDLIINMPLGSVVTNVETGDVYDITNDGEAVRILRGGRGGYGNEHFKSSRNVTPWEQTDGKPGECGIFKVELRLIADAGLIGYPNAGKSTLLNALTNASAKVGNYAFTTLDPNLGVLDGYVLADIPGLIDGASEGKGLGDKFLRHIMRTNVLIHCISAERESVLEAYNAIRNELKAYNKELLDKKELIVITKSDLITTQERREEIVTELGGVASNIIFVSSYDADTLDLLRTEIRRMLDK